MKHLYIFLAFIFFLSCDNPDEKQTMNAPGKVSSAFADYNFTVINGDSIATLKGKTIDFVKQGAVKNGKRQGFWLTNPDRTHTRLQSLKYYIDGVLNGPYYEFTNNGELELATNYLDGKIHGDYTEYKYGTPNVIAHYINGNLNGKRTAYFTEPDIRHNIQKIEYFKMGKLDGTITWYNPEGKKTMEYVYKNGEKISGGIVED